MSTVTRAIVQAAVLAGMSIGANQAYAACTFGAPGESSLQGTFDALLGTAAPEAATACVPDGADAAWTTTGSVASAQIIIELAGNAQSNTFGVYDLGNPGNQLMVFDGSAGPSAQATLQLKETIDGWTVRVLGPHTSGWTSMAVSTSAFGFYLGTATQGTFFSDTALNADGIDHMYAYAGTGAPFLSGPFAGDLFSVNDYILAWEDLAGGGDRDYQDFVALVTDVTPVPLPTALWLLASGLISLAGVARRRA